MKVCSGFFFVAVSRSFKQMYQQESIPVGCVPPACWPGGVCPGCVRVSKEVSERCCRQTDTYENITFPSTSFEGGNNMYVTCRSQHSLGYGMTCVSHNVRAYSHQAKAGAKAKAIKEQVKKVKELMVNIKEMFRFRVTV